MLVKGILCLIFLVLISEVRPVNGDNCSLSAKKSRRTHVKVHSARRQNIQDEGPTDPPPLVAPGSQFHRNPVEDNNNRFSTQRTTLKRKRTRTTVMRITFEENCDYLAYYCMKAYDTGIVCARSLYFIYENFKNYCLVDYVNCLERYQVWLVVHMGECFEPGLLSNYEAYPHYEDKFLDQMYVAD